MLQLDLLAPLTPSLARSPLRVGKHSPAQVKTICKKLGNHAYLPSSSFRNELVVQVIINVHWVERIYWMTWGGRCEQIRSGRYLPFGRKSGTSAGVQICAQCILEASMGLSKVSQGCSRVLSQITDENIDFPLVTYSQTPTSRQSGKSRPPDSFPFVTNSEMFLWRFEITICKSKSWSRLRLNCVACHNTKTRVTWWGENKLRSEPICQISM
jgi:hypothetical protein